MNTHFLTRLGEFFRSNKEAIEAGEMSPEDVAEAFRKARASSGGKQKADNRMSMSESFGNGGDWKLFMEQQFAEPPQTIQVLPKPGSYSHPRYGKFTMSPENIAAFVENHNNHVYQEQVPIDAEHESKLSGAVGYYREMRLIDGGIGGAEADVEWTERGRQLIASDQFKYFSPEWFDEWSDPVGGKKVAHVLVGGAITTRPFFKDKVMRPLVASESAYEAGEWLEGGADGTPTLVMRSMKFSEFKPFEKKDDEEDEDDSKKKANLDVGDVHVDKAGGKDKKAKEGESPDGSSNPGGKKMSDDEKVIAPDAVTKEFVEAQAKSFKEELDAEKGLRVAAETRLAALENDAQTRRFSDVIMGRDAAGDGSAPFAGKHEMHNKTLALIAKEHGEESEQFTEYVAEQRAVSKQMREAGLFKEVGVGSAPGQLATNTATRRFDDAVTAWMTANPGKTKFDAVPIVAAENSKLYVESVKEKNRTAKVASTTYGYEDEGEAE